MMSLSFENTLFIGEYVFNMLIKNNFVFLYIIESWLLLIDGEHEFLTISNLF